MTGEDLPVVQVGPVAHGGSCVARLDGQVVFVRHTLPGERVRIRVTDRTTRYLRADAVEILEASPDRVTPPCALAGVCGGCDFQHVDPDAQLRLLGSVVSEQLQRLAGIEREVLVEPVSPALGWRTRVTWSTTPDGRPGLRRHRSHEVVPVDTCPIAHPDLPDVLSHRWDASPVEAIVSSTGERLVVTDAAVPKDLDTDGVAAQDGSRRSGRVRLTEQVADHTFTVTGSGFWQVHPAAARTLVDAVMGAAEVRPGDRVADLYAGVGLFSAFLADRVGPTGTVVSVEADRQGARDARRSLHRHENVTLVADTTERAVRHEPALRGGVDVVVLDPPRTGARRAVPDIAALGARRLVYVACDPAALARDVAALAEHGYRLGPVRAFGLFPMTHHVECVAVLDRDTAAAES